jgi:ubiquinone/menaquinone biosynthesis C-methylase UbiE
MRIAIEGSRPDCSGSRNASSIVTGGPVAEPFADQFYEEAGSLFVEAYDAFYGAPGPRIAGDVAFYERVARETGGPVLELACGTGRIALPLAKAGLHVTGVDRSGAMLSIARRKLAAVSASVQERLSFVHQNMTALDLGQRFGFAFVPFRSFQHLLTIDLQRKSLEAIRRHLEPSGRLALHLFDPRLDWLIDPELILPRLSGTHPETGRRYVGEIVRTSFDHLHQIRRDLWRYAEIGPNGEVLAEDTREMALRWTYRWELRHLLELCGLAVDAEYSDFTGSAPAYGKELILLARIA